MNWQYTPLVFPLLIATGVALGFAGFSWKRRPAIGATSFAIFMLAAAVWALGDALRLVSTDLPAKILWAKFRYLGVVAIPTAWLSLVLEYTRRERWLTRRNQILLAVEPVIFLLLVWTNENHHLIWRSDGELVMMGPWVVWHAPHGFLFWVHAAYSYLLLLLTTILLVLALFRRSLELSRMQAGILLIGTLTPLVGNVLSALHLVDIPLDVTPFVFTLVGLPVAWGVSPFRLFDIVPVARRAVVNSMNDGFRGGGAIHSSADA